MGEILSVGNEGQPQKTGVCKKSRRESGANQQEDVAKNLKNLVGQILPWPIYRGIEIIVSTREMIKCSGGVGETMERRNLMIRVARLDLRHRIMRGPQAGGRTEKRSELKNK